MNRKQPLFHLEKFFNLSPDLLCVANLAGYFERVNPAFSQILGYTQEELLSRPLIDFIHHEDAEKTQQELNKLLEGVAVLHFENRCRTKQGEYHWFSWKAYFEYHTGLLYAIARDVSEKKLLENKLLELTRRDPLTGTLNRRGFIEICKKEIRAASKSDKPISLIIFDLDHFKEYNDNKGHIKGDKALQQISKTIQNKLGRRRDAVCRYGGDEFVLLLSRTPLHTAMELAEDIRHSIAALNIYYQINGNKQFLTATLGVAALPPGGNATVRKFIAIADTALYRAKQAGKNQVVGMNTFTT